MKAQIHRLPNNHWRLSYQEPSLIRSILITKSIDFMFSDGAFNHWAKIEAKIFRAQKAFSLLNALLSNAKFVTRSTVAEYHYIMKLKASNCSHITKAQYGYLVGIYERTTNGI